MRVHQQKWYRINWGHRIVRMNVIRTPARIRMKSCWACFRLCFLWKQCQCFWLLCPQNKNKAYNIRFCAVMFWWHWEEDNHSLDPPTRLRWVKFLMTNKNEKKNSIVRCLLPPYGSEILIRSVRMVRLRKQRKHSRKASFSTANAAIQLVLFTLFLIRL